MSSSSPVVRLESPPHQIVAELEGEFGLNESDLAQILSIDPRTLRRWRTGEAHPQHEARARLVALQRLARRLQDTFTSVQAIQSWLRHSNRYLSQLSPAEVLRAGRIDRVDAALEALDSGIFV
jgi:uncharacterized protein (DUF2384 family)